MKSRHVIAPVLATGLLLGACSTETGTASPADAALLNAYSSCRLVMASTENSAIKGKSAPRVNIEVMATKSAQAGAGQIHYGKLIGHLLRYGVMKPLADVPFEWYRNAGGSESQTKAYEMPNVELLTQPLPGDREPIKHEVIAVYATAQNDSRSQPKSSERYCGEIVIGETGAGTLYADIVEPLTPPTKIQIENSWGIGDEHCQVTC